jgi:hypothetical protein
MFEIDVKQPSTTAPNIRIVEFLPKKDWDRNKLYLGFFITLGYDKFQILGTVFRHISFCPYCGTNLKSFYKTNAYANEIEGKTFSQ